MKVELLKASQADALEDFVATHPHGSIEQTWLWGELQCSIPGREDFYVLVVKKSEKIVASMLMIRQYAGMGRTWLWCPRGPLLPEHGEEAWIALKKGAVDYVKAGKDVFMRIEPGVPKDEPFAPEGDLAPNSYMPQQTLMLNLKPNEQGILKQMAQKGRYNIKKSGKSGVTVRVGDITELDTFYELLRETAKRDGFHLHSKDFYLNFLEDLGEKALFYLAFSGDELLGGLFVSYFGERATYYFGASSNTHRKLMAPYALQWFAIQEAKRAGMETYDFLGIAPEGDDKHVLAGVTQFKTRFGGSRVDYHKAQVFVFSRPWWWLYRFAKMLRK